MRPTCDGAGVRRRADVDGGPPLTGRAVRPPLDCTTRAHRAERPRRRTVPGSGLRAWGVADSGVAEAVAECRAANLTGWELVDYATRLVSAQFSTYSVLHPWASPEAAFRDRRGFCTQYNGALAVILRELGLDARLVYAARVRFEDRRDWPLGHTWVRVRLDGEIRDVCARSMDNQSGRVHFVPICPVRKLDRITRFLTTAGSFGTASAAITRSRLSGRPRPTWVEHPRPQR